MENNILWHCGWFFFSWVTVLFSLGLCEEPSCRRKGAIRRAPAGRGSRPYTPPRNFYSSHSCGHCTYPCFLGDVSQSLGFSTHRGEYRTRTNKAWMLESLQQILELYLLLQRPLSLTSSKLQDAVSFWFLKATLLLIWYHADCIARAFFSDALHRSWLCTRFCFM